MAKKLGEVAETTENKELETSNDAITPTNEQNESVNTEEKAEDNKETEVKKQTQSNGNTKHVVTYVGGGVWIDMHNKHWANKEVPGTDIMSSREFTDEEYSSRQDIIFMVQYGAMKLTTVTI